jgi:hypothetical protein
MNREDDAARATDKIKRTINARRPERPEGEIIEPVSFGCGFRLGKIHSQNVARSVA